MQPGLAPDTFTEELVCRDVDWVLIFVRNCFVSIGKNGEQFIIKYANWPNNYMALENTITV